MLGYPIRQCFNLAQASAVAQLLGVDLDTEGIDLKEFARGMQVELEHGRRDPQTDVTHDDPIITGKIALAHLREFPDYYERLARMEREAEAWSDQAPVPSVATGEERLPSGSFDPFSIQDRSATSNRKLQ